MTVTLHLPPELATNLATQAQARGITIDALLTLWLASFAGRQIPSQKRSIADLEKWEKDLDDWLDTVPELPTLSDEAVSRESIYTREDNW
jgi:hypothetical protein